MKHNPSIFLDDVKSKSIKGLIVLSLEELKETWMAGFNRADPENINPAPTFQSYLKSKGIKTINNG